MRDAPKPAPRIGTATVVVLQLREEQNCLMLQCTLIFGFADLSFDFRSISVAEKTRRLSVVLGLPCDYRRTSPTVISPYTIVKFTEPSLKICLKFNVLLWVSFSLLFGIS